MHCDGEHLVYVDLGDYAHHLVELMRRNQTREFAAVFDAVELLHLEGDDYVREAATVGLLEGAQNVAGWAEVKGKGVSPEALTKHLRPETIRQWRLLNEQWDLYFRELRQEFGEK